MFIQGVSKRCAISRREIPHVKIWPIPHINIGPTLLCFVATGSGPCKWNIQNGSSKSFPIMTGDGANRQDFWTGILLTDNTTWATTGPGPIRMISLSWTFAAEVCVNFCCDKCGCVCSLIFRFWYYVKINFEVLYHLFLCNSTFFSSMIWYVMIC